MHQLQAFITPPLGRLLRILETFWHDTGHYGNLMISEICGLVIISVGVVIILQTNAGLKLTRMQQITPSETDPKVCMYVRHVRNYIGLDVARGLVHIISPFREIRYHP